MPGPWGRRGLAMRNEMGWLVKDVSEKMKSWGHQGGDGGHIIFKSDGERSIVTLRTAFAKYHGRRSCPRTRRAGKTVREFVPVLREHVQDKAEVEQGASDGMVRWSAMMVSRFLGCQGRAHGVREEAWQEMKDPGRGVRRKGVVQGDQAGQGAHQQVGERVARGALAGDTAAG